MVDPTDTNWNDMWEAQKAVNAWANKVFPGRDAKASMLKLVSEEIPELLSHIKQHGTSNKLALSDEAADCLILLLDCFEIWGLDAASSLRHKMKINFKRQWKKDLVTGFYNHVDPPDSEGGEV